MRLCLETEEPHDCRVIVDSQRRKHGVTSYVDFQLPEPWVGEIDVAPILFVSSNPSIGDDKQTTGAAADDDVWESHHFAHGGGRRSYIQDGIRTTDSDGNPLQAVRYWSGALARARELIPYREVVPGRDYAMTEIVHCKSRREFGVAAAAKTCAARHMENVLSISAARVVVSVGAFARNWFLGEGVSIPVSPIERTLGGRERLLIFTPHFSPNNGGPQKIPLRYSADDVTLLIEAIRAG